MLFRGIVLGGSGRDMGGPGWMWERLTGFTVKRVGIRVEMAAGRVRGGGTVGKS